MSAKAMNEMLIDTEKQSNLPNSYWMIYQKRITLNQLNYKQITHTKTDTDGDEINYYMGRYKAATQVVVEAMDSLYQGVIRLALK